MWKGRFADKTARLVEQFGESISYDWRLFEHDIAGSVAHARAQMNAGLLTADAVRPCPPPVRGALQQAYLFRGLSGSDGALTIRINGAHSHKTNGELFNECCHDACRFQRFQSRRHFPG